jgi:hypothetical protein
MVPITSVNFRRNVADPDLRPWNPSENGTLQYPRPRPLEKDQTSEDASVKSLLHAKEQRRPIVLIAGSGYRWWPLSMRRSPNEQNTRAKYVVLGWYLIRDAWEEFEPVSTVYTDAARLFVRWKFSFEWIEAQGKPWWISDLEQAAAPVVIGPSLALQHPPTMHNEFETHCDNSNPDRAICNKEDTEPFPQPVLFVAESSTTTQTIEEQFPCTLPDQDSGPPSLPLIQPEPIQCVTYGRACYHCNKYSPLIYHQGWFCSYSSCSQFCLVRVNPKLSSS